MAKKIYVFLIYHIDQFNIYDISRITLYAVKIAIVVMAWSACPYSPYHQYFLKILIITSIATINASDCGSDRNQRTRGLLADFDPPFRTKVEQSGLFIGNRTPYAQVYCARAAGIIGDGAGNMRVGKEIRSQQPLLSCACKVFSYAVGCFFCLRAPDRAAKPVPRSSMEAGSGVGWGVCWIFWGNCMQQGRQLAIGSLIRLGAVSR